MSEDQRRRAIDLAYGKRAKAIREAKRLNLSDVCERAEKLGLQLDPSVLSKLERGILRWNSAYQARVALALGVEDREIAGGLFEDGHSLTILTQAL